MLACLLASPLQTDNWGVWCDIWGWGKVFGGPVPSTLLNVSPASPPACTWKMWLMLNYKCTLPGVYKMLLVVSAHFTWLQCSFTCFSSFLELIETCFVLNTKTNITAWVETSSLFRTTHRCSDKMNSEIQPHEILEQMYFSCQRMYSTSGDSTLEQMRFYFSVCRCGHRKVACNGEHILAYPRSNRFLSNATQIISSVLANYLIMVPLSYTFTKHHRSW